MIVRATWVLTGILLIIYSFLWSNISDIPQWRMKQDIFTKWVVQFWNKLHTYILLCTTINWKGIAPSFLEIDQIWMTLLLLMHCRILELVSLSVRESTMLFWNQQESQTWWTLLVLCWVKKRAAYGWRNCRISSTEHLLEDQYPIELVSLQLT